VLVSCSETVVEGSIEGTPEATFADLLESNLTASFRVARTCFAAMRQAARGSIIHVTPDSGIRAAHETAAVSVVSAGVIALAEVLAAEGAGHGIRCNAVCPHPGVDVAPIVAWLACDEAAHVSGATLRVDDAAGAAMMVDTRLA
jgi:NAD(P)-dependent dehydrogenase (short-subunit alcohol dehydrogenase family)